MSSPASKALLKKYPQLRAKIQKVQQEVLGYAPPSFQNQRTGFQASKRQLQGVYLNQYYDAHTSITRHAQDIMGTEYTTELQERRQQKLARLRRNGKGAPKKGSGKKKK